MELDPFRKRLARAGLKFDWLESGEYPYALYRLARGRVVERDWFKSREERYEVALRLVKRSERGATIRLTRD